LLPYESILLISKVTPELLASLCLWNEKGLPITDYLICFDTLQMLAYVMEENGSERRVQITKFLFLGDKSLELFLPDSLRDYRVENLE